MRRPLIICMQATGPSTTVDTAAPVAGSGQSASQARQRGGGDVSELATGPRIEGYGKAILEELAAFVTLFGSMWRILRHPIRFDDHVRKPPKQVAKFFFVTAAL